MHIHLRSRSLCSKMSVEGLYNGLSQRIDGICITDHWILKPINISSFFDVSIFFGVEVNCDLGDILAYGIKVIPSKNLPAKEMIDFIHKQEGIAVCAHPFSTHQYAFGENVYDFEFDAIEINGAVGKKYNKMAFYSALIMELPTIGGSDAHSINQLNTIGTKFYMPIRSMSDIILAIKTKKCKAIRI